MIHNRMILLQLRPHCVVVPLVKTLYVNYLCLAVRNKQQINH